MPKSKKTLSTPARASMLLGAQPRLKLTNHEGGETGTTSSTTTAAATITTML